MKVKVELIVECPDTNNGMPTVAGMVTDIIQGVLSHHMDKKILILKASGSRVAEEDTKHGR